MSHIQRSPAFPPGGYPSWPLSQPPCWRGFAGAPAPGLPAATAWWRPGDILAFDFANGRYMRDGETASLGAVLSASRTSPATWFTDAGILQPFDANVAAITDRGLYAGGQRVNKCRNFNANPTDLTGVSKAGDAAAMLTVVDDSAELAAAGLDGICTSGMAFQFDNSAGTSTSWLYIAGNSGNTNPHTMSVYMRSTGSARMVLSSSGGTGWMSSASYTRRSATVTPANSSQQIVIEVAAGKVVWFILNQLEEGSFASPPIVTDGGTGTTRLADAVTVPGFAALAASGSLQDGFAGKAILDVTRLTDPASRCIFDLGVATGDRVRLDILTDNRIELAIANGGSGPALQTAALAATGEVEIEWQVKSGASFIRIGGTTAAENSDSFTMPELADAHLGQSRSGASALNGPLGYLSLRRAV